MEDDVTGCRVSEQCGIHLKGAEGEFLFFLILLPHREPDIGIDDVRVLGSDNGIVRDSDVGGVEFFQKRGARCVVGGAGNGKSKAEVFRRPHPRDSHVGKAIADEGDFFTRPPTEEFLHSEQIGEDLAGVFFICERIDHGDAGELGKIDNILLIEGADDDAVNHATEHAGGVLDGFAAAELDVVFREKHREAAELADADLEGHAGAGGGLSENHRPSLARQSFLVGTALRLEARGIGEQVLDGRGVQVFDRKQVLHGVREK